MDATDLDADELFLDAVDAVVLAALEQIGSDPEAGSKFFRRLLAAAGRKRTPRLLRGSGVAQSV